MKKWEQYSRAMGQIPHTHWKLSEYHFQYLTQETASYIKPWVKLQGEKNNNINKANPKITLLNS